MAKNPILPLYYNDLLGSTKTWTDEEFGAYMRLLIEQWDKGGLPNDSQRLARLYTSHAANWELLKDKFPLVDGLLKNPVMEEVRQKRARHSEKQALNAKQRAKQYAKPLPNISQNEAKKMPLENEYENENEKVIERKEVQEETIDARLDTAFNDLYLEPLSMKAPTLYPGVDFTLELERFKLKVKGSPRVYADRDSGGLRAAFEFQLRSMSASSPTVRVNGRNQPRPKAFNLSEI